MESRTKSKVSEAQVMQVIHRNFPQDEVTKIMELKEGLFNRAYLIQGTGELDKGIVLKIGPSPDILVLSCEKDIMRTEIAVYDMLKKSEVPTPKILEVNTNRDLLDCDYFLMEKLEGVTWKSVQNSMNPQTRSRLLEELGYLTGVMHRIKGTHFGYINRRPEDRCQTWGEAYALFMTDCLKDARSFGYELPYEKLEILLKDYRELLDQIKEPVLTDNDLFGNIFLDPVTFEITGVVDFERALFADPMMDFAACLTLFDDVEKVPEYLRGYERGRGRNIVITPEDRKRMKLYYLYKAVNVFTEGYRYEDTFRGRVQGYMKMRIDSLLNDIEKNK